MPLPSFRTSRPRVQIRALSLLAASALALALPGCDNPACVFGGDCSGGGAIGLGANPATIPSDGVFLSGNAPTITDVFPDGTDVDTRSPVVIEFSESMSPANLNIAFELVAGGAASGAVPFGVNALLGEGRLLVLMPLTPLIPSTEYTVRFRQGVSFQDLTGQVVVQPADRVVGTFSTGAMDPTAPSVVATWPPDGAVDQGATGEIVAVFSRPIAANSVSDSSFQVTVNGSAPAFDPVAAPLTVNGGAVTDQRVLRWRSVDNSGNPVPFANSGQVAVTLSPTASPLVDSMNEAVPQTTFDFRVAAFAAPTAAALTSVPTDAIGINQVSGPADLALQLAIPDGQAGDMVVVTLFGTKVTPDMDPPLIALERTVALAAPFTTFTLAASDLNLLSSASPLAARFADGTIGIAVQLKRGNKLSPVRMLDADPLTAGVQNVVLDTVAPTLTGLGTSGTAVGTFRSDLRDLVIVGRASEALRSVLVQTPANGDNDVNSDGVPPVVGSTANGLFVAAAVPIGLDASAIPYDVTIFDRALNSGGIASGTFRQVGAVSGATLLPGDDMTIEVFDETTLAPITGASVFVHENVNDDVTSLANGSTDAAGQVTLPSSFAGETIVTVFASGYELFTFDGVLVDRLSVPLRPSALSDAGAAGLVATTLATFNVFTKGFADSRTRDTADRISSVNGCAFDTTQSRFECTFGSVPVRAREIGAQSVFGVQPPPNLFLYSPLTFLHGFQLQVPAPELAPGAPVPSAASELTVPFLLSDPATAAEERAIDAPPLVLSTANYPGMTGAVRVTVEARVPGVRGTAVVGQGVAFDVMPPSTNFAVRAAYPGSVDGIQDVATDELGRFVKSGTIDPDLMVRSEIVEAGGARGGNRPRLSTMPIAIQPPAPAQLDATTPIALNAAGEALDVLFGDVLPDALNEPGLYRVVFEDSAGKRWTVVRPDMPDGFGPNALVHLPLVGAGTTLPLAPGALDCRISAFAWPTFDAGSFLWTDVEREFDAYSHSATQAVTPP